MRNPGLPKVAIFGIKDISELPPAEQLLTHQAAKFETADLSIVTFADDTDLNRILREVEPQAIVTVGVMESFTHLMAAPSYVRRKWIHYRSAAEIRGIEIFHCFLQGAMPARRRPETPRKISVYTPVYNTGYARLMRTYRSLTEQSYRDWEWVLADDHSGDPDTLTALQEIAQDYRATVHRFKNPSGNIGELKGRLCGLCSGDIFLELDHDDVLTPDALAWIAAAFNAYPECGVAYTNWSERYEDSDLCHGYGDDYAFGYGKAHWEVHPRRYETFTPGDAHYYVQDSLRLNAKTIRHIVGVPNHIRAWTREAYAAAGGYSSLHVADDYELLVRSFLATRFVHIPKLCYLQFYNNTSIGNTQSTRNKEIQRIVRFVAQHYDQRIHERLVQLGVDDFIWDASAQRCDWEIPNPEEESHCSVIFQT